MTNDRLSGLALILGSSGMIITMSLHPTGHVARDQMVPMIRMAIAVHTLALACLPLMFLGAWGLSRCMRGADDLALTGLVVYGFALVAVMNAAVASGLVTPAVLRQMVATAAPASDLWLMIQHYTFYVNQGFAQVFVAGSSAAIVLWSVAMWRSKELGRGLGIYGCLLGAATLIALFSGHLNLDVHGFGVVIFGQAAWFIIGGALLLKREDQVAAAGRNQAS
jgi:hypothetical protein